MQNRKGEISAKTKNLNSNIFLKNLIFPQATEQSWQAGGLSHQLI